MEPEHIRLDYNQLTTFIRNFMGSRTNRIIPKYGYVDQKIMQDELKQERLAYVKKDGEWVPVIKREGPKDMEDNKLKP